MTVLERKRSAPSKPNYITLLPPGRIIAEKIFEMGIDAPELARRCSLSLETIQQLLKAEIPLTNEIAKVVMQSTY